MPQKLSVITINLNNADGLSKTLASVFSQTTKNFEYIIIDGGSTDNSIAIIKDWIAKGNNIKFISERDNGIYDAMNKGIEMTSCEYCLFLNSGDCLAFDDSLEILLKNSLWGDIISCNAIYEESKYHKEEYIMSPKEIKASDLLYSFLPHQATLIRKDLFYEIHKYDINYKIVSDALFFIEALLVWNKSYQHIQLFLSSCNTEGISSLPQNCEYMRNEFWDGVQKILPRFSEDYLRNKNNLQHQLKRNTCLITKYLRKGLKVSHYYEIKKNIKVFLFNFRIVVKDDIKKIIVISKIKSLPNNLLINNNDSRDIIVSLTSYGKRIKKSLPFALYSLLQQTILPNRIVVYLDISWGTKKLPKSLRMLEKKGIEFHFCDDTGPYKKLLPALKEFPENPIITVDDDFYYNPELISWLVDRYRDSDQKTVIGSWGAIVLKKNGIILPYLDFIFSSYGNDYSRYTILGGNGTLYPPKIFDEEIFNLEIINKICPHADDIWFWAMEERLGIKRAFTIKTGNTLHTPVDRINVYSLAHSKRNTLCYENCIMRRNNQQFQNVVDYYHL